MVSIRRAVPRSSLVGLATIALATEGAFHHHLVAGWTTTTIPTTTIPTIGRRLRHTHAPTLVAAARHSNTEEEEEDATEENDPMDSETRLREAFGDLFGSGNRSTSTTRASSGSNVERNSVVPHWKGTYPKQKLLPLDNQIILQPETQTSSSSSSSFDVSEEVVQQMQQAAAGSFRSNNEPSISKSGDIDDDTDWSFSSPLLLSDDDDDEKDGVLLNEQQYLQTRDRLNPDGSLNFSQQNNNNSNRPLLDEHILKSILIEHPDLPDSLLTDAATTKDDTASSLQDLVVELQQQQQRTNDPNNHESSNTTSNSTSTSQTSEELHRSVFENEQGYLQQSEVFRKSLGGQKDAKMAAKKATALRRGANFRHTQAEALSTLERNLEEFEASSSHFVPFSLEEEEDEDGSRSRTTTTTTTNNDDDDTTSPIASKAAVALESCTECGCAMSNDEMDHYRMEEQQARGNVAAVATTTTTTSQPPRRLCQICYSDVLERETKSQQQQQQPSSPSFRSYTDRNRYGGGTSRSPPVRVPSSSLKPTTTVAQQQRQQQRRLQDAVVTKRPAAASSSPSPPRRYPAESRNSPPAAARTATPRTTTNDGNDGNDGKLQIRQLTAKMKFLEEQLRTYKEKSEMAEQEIVRLKGTVTELNSDLREALAATIESQNASGEIASSPWTEVTDPDTGEVFYWNEDTEEMKWDL